MEKKEFRELLAELPVDICDSCYWIGSSKCVKGPKWKNSDERKENRMHHYEDCSDYVYWEKRYAELDWDRDKIMQELGMK